MIVVITPSLAGFCITVQHSMTFQVRQKKNLAILYQASLFFWSFRPAGNTQIEYYGIIINRVY